MAAPLSSAIALDLGTTSIKAGLLDSDGKLDHIITQAAPEIVVNGGRYESDALAYAKAAEQALGECLARTGCSPPLGLCCQRSSFLIWERASGQPLTPLISWQDNRGAASCDELRDVETLIRELTGLRLTQYYFAPKLRTVLREQAEWRTRLERGELMLGTLDSFLIWRWTNGQHHVTDASMAARTLLMDIRTQQWSPQLCGLFDIPVSMLPQILPSAGMNLPLMKPPAIRPGHQKTPATSLVMNQGLILQASLGDQSAALIASVGEKRSGVLVNLGTGGFVIRYLDQNGNAQDGYLRTLVYQDKKRQAHIAIEGTLNSLAAALAPCPARECRAEELASLADIYCLAEPSGLGAPYFRNDLGVRFSEPVEHLAPRQIACLLQEGIIFRVARILEDFHRTAAIERVYLSGGLSGLVCLQQGIALCAPCDVYRLPQKDSSLQGAALLAAGMVSTVQCTAEKIETTRNDGALQEKYRRWKDWFDTVLNPS